MADYECCVPLFSPIFWLCFRNIWAFVFLIVNLLNNWLLRYAGLMRIVFLLYANKHFLVCFNGLEGFFFNNLQ